MCERCADKLYIVQDTVTALSTLVQPSFEGTFAVLHLALFSIMHPTSAVRTSWDTFVLLLLFSVCIITPVCSRCLYINLTNIHLHKFIGLIHILCAVHDMLRGDLQRCIHCWCVHIPQYAYAASLCPSNTLWCTFSWCQAVGLYVSISEVCGINAGIWEVVMDAAFILDVLLNFRTAFIGTDFLVTDPSAIAVNYLKVFSPSTTVQAEPSTQVIYVM